MPIYAYKCESCGHTKDVLQKMSDAPLSDCPQCGAPAFKKQVTAAVAVGVGSAPGYARMLRTQTLQVSAAPYVETALALGRSRSSILWHPEPGIDLLVYSREL